MGIDKYKEIDRLPTYQQLGTNNKDKILLELYEADQYHRNYHQIVRRKKLGIILSSLLVVTAFAFLVWFWLLSIVLAGFGGLIIFALFYSLVEDRQGFKHHLKMKLFPKLIPIILPQFEYIRVPKFHRKIEKWPREDEKYYFISDKVVYHIGGKLKSINIELYQLTFKRWVYEEKIEEEEWLKQSNYKGIYMELTSLPHNFSIEVLKSIEMQKTLDKLKTYWSGNVYCFMSDKRTLGIFIQTNRELFKLPHPGKTNWYNKFELDWIYDPLYYCLHCVEVLAEELAKEDSHKHDINQ